MPNDLRSVLALARYACLSYACAAAAPELGAQAPTLAAAVRLRDAGDVQGAASLLRERLHQVPDDGDATRVLAQLTYWLGDRPGASAIYEGALQRFPADTAVRLEYGHMLVETMRSRRAREVLMPLTPAGRAAPRAHLLLARLAYWLGDRSAAARHARTAANHAATRDEALGLLRELAVLTAAWARAAATYGRDDQPLVQHRGEFALGWYATPNWAIAVIGGAASFPEGGEATRAVGDALVAVSGFAPGLNSSLEARAGLQQRSFGRRHDAIGAATLRVRLAPMAILRGGIERMPYLHTAASLDSAVVPLAFHAGVEFARHRWEGEVAGQLQRFSDGNRIRTAYAWGLLPLARARSHLFQVGYAFAYHDASESRFAPLPGAPRTQPNDTTHIAGRFVPYFTPDDLVSHSVLGAATVANADVSMRVDGRYGIRATDRESFLYRAAAPPGQPGAVIRSSFPRRYAPTEARTALTLGTRSATTLRVAAEYRRTIYYARTEVSATITRRFSWAFRP